MFKKIVEENKTYPQGFNPNTLYYTPHGHGVPPPQGYDTHANKLDVPFDYLTGDTKIIKHRHQNEEEYFEADSDEEKANTKAMKRELQGGSNEPIDEEDLDYIPAPGSPTLQELKNANEDDDDLDPLEAFMSGIEKQATKDLKEIEKKKDTKQDKRGQRQDIENEDEQESFFRYMEENPLAGVAYIDDDFALEYDADGRPIIPERLKIVDPLPPIDHTLVKYAPFNREFYTEAPDISQLSSEQVKELRQKLGVYVTGAQPLKPVCSFAHFNFDKAIMALLRKHEFTQPTPIQAQGMPIALSGRDLIGIAKTGSGKTLTYILPMVIHILDQEPLKMGQGPIGLILVPTRELCLQVYNECKKFSPRFNLPQNKSLDESVNNNSNTEDANLRILCAYGGGSMWEQQKALENGCDILVATPGRLIDLIKKRALSLEKVTYLVLDEADRMFDLGFESQVRSITNHVRPDRQTLLFSATFKRKIEKLARDVCTDPLKVVQGDYSASNRFTGGAGQANEDVEQDVKIFVDNAGKFTYLKQNLVRYLSTGSVLIFVTKKINAEEVAQKLNRNDMKAGLLHGDLLQPERTKILGAFKRREISLLVATDVAARGLDIPHIRTVVNYDIARDIDTHTHRVGRTGRAGQKGFAITFITSRDKEFAGHLVRNLEGANQPVPPGLLELATQSSWFRKTRFGGKNSGNKNAGGLYKKPGIGGAGLGFKQNNKDNSSPATANNNNYLKSSTSFINTNYTNEITTLNKNQQTPTVGPMGPGTERLTNIRAAFQAQYKNHFKASITQPPKQVFSLPKTAFVKPKESPQAISISNSENKSEKRNKKSRWE